MAGRVKNAGSAAPQHTGIAAPQIAMHQYGQGSMARQPLGHQRQQPLGPRHGLARALQQRQLGGQPSLGEKISPIGQPTVELDRRADVVVCLPTKSLAPMGQLRLAMQPRQAFTQLRPTLIAA